MLRRIRGEANAQVYFGDNAPPVAQDQLILNHNGKLYHIMHVIDDSTIAVEMVRKKDYPDMDYPLGYRNLMPGGKIVVTTGGMNGNTNVPVDLFLANYHNTGVDTPKYAYTWGRGNYFTITSSDEYAPGGFWYFMRDAERVLLEQTIEKGYLGWQVDIEVR